MLILFNWWQTIGDDCEFWISACCKSRFFDKTDVVEMTSLFNFSNKLLFLTIFNIDGTVWLVLIADGNMFDFKFWAWIDDGIGVEDINWSKFSLLISFWSALSLLLLLIAVVLLIVIVLSFDFCLSLIFNEDDRIIFGWLFFDVFIEELGVNFSFKFLK